MNAVTFSSSIYRTYNLDLRHLNDKELQRHFDACQHEQRIFGPTKTTAEFLSMRWLRGTGLEVGAGGYPIKTFGATKILQADLDSDLLYVYGGEKLDVQASLDDPTFPRRFKSQFDFSVASHVLEHCDSFIRALENLVAVTKPGGIVYIALPDIDFLQDSRWLDHYDFTHHVAEYTNPLAFADTHDQAYIEALSAGIDSHNEHATLPAEYKLIVKAGKIPPHYRFVHHKHNYRFGGWNSMVEETRRFLGGKFEIAEASYGYQRFDCHFVLKVS